MFKNSTVFVFSNFTFKYFLISFLKNPSLTLSPGLLLSRYPVKSENFLILMSSTEIKISPSLIPALKAPIFSNTLLT